MSVEPASPLPWRVLKAGPGWLLQADDGSWVANFHSQADAEYVIAALEVYHRFHVLEEAEAERKPASPLPWRVGTHHKYVKTADGLRRRSVVIDPSGREVAHVLTSEGGDFRDAEYLVHAANACPRLRERLDKALEACRALIECESERIERSTPDFEEADHLPEDYVGVPPEPDAYLRAVALARAALEMAGEERDRRG